MKLSTKTARRFSVAAAVGMAFLLSKVPAQADPKATPRPTASPVVLHSKQANLDLQKDKIVDMQNKRSANNTPKQATTKNLSKTPTATASPSVAPLTPKKKPAKGN